MNDVKRAVLESIRKYKRISYVDLEELFEQLGFDYRGNYAVGAESRESNLITWSGWNVEALNVIGELLDENLIEQIRVHPDIYHIVGEGLTLPIAKTTRAYKEPHWLPSAFIACKPERKKQNV